MRGEGLELAERVAGPKGRTAGKVIAVAGWLAALLLLALPFLAGWVGLGRVSLPAGAAARATAGVRLDKKRPVYIGTPLRYTVLVEAGPSRRIDPPAWPKAKEDPGYELRQVRAGGHRRLLGGVQRRFTYELVFYRTGTVTVPGPSGAVRGGAKRDLYRANSVQVTVQSLLPKDKTQFSPQDLRDVKPPVDLPFDWLALAAILLAVMVLAAAVWILLRFLRGRRKRSETPARDALPPEPAHLIARRELEEIRTWPDEAGHDAESFFIRLSACIRRYLLGRFGLKAPELTTEELLPMAVRDRQLPGEAGTYLAGLASCWDLVKFARHRPPSEMMREAWRQAYEFVELTKEDRPTGTEDGKEPVDKDEAAS